jgi:hypothetical protein
VARQVDGNAGGKLEKLNGPGRSRADEPDLRGVPSNWELCIARALEVTGVLVAQGVDPRVFSGAGCGEFDPVDINDSTAVKAHNRPRRRYRSSRISTRSWPFRSYDVVGQRVASP